VEAAAVEAVAQVAAEGRAAWAALRPVQGPAAAAFAPTADIGRHIRWACPATK